MKTYSKLNESINELQKFCEHHQFDTDKYTDHCYVNQYYGYEFADCRDSKLKILEIGIYTGGSVDMFNHWMPHSEFHGIEYATTFSSDDWGRARPLNYVNSQLLQLQKKLSKCSNLHLKWGIDAYCEDTLNLFNDNYFDYIIDDGPHSYESQLYCVDNWLDKLKSGGKMIIEDVRLGIPEMESLAKDQNAQSFSLYDFTQSTHRCDDRIVEIVK